VHARKDDRMIDVILIAVTCLTFALAFALVWGFERL
jgi:hypothetical protein